MDIGKPLNTSALFSGGAGMFIQYHDIVKPAYLFAILKMIITKEDYGIPINIISNLSILSLTEWYLKRRYINPLKCLDYNKKLNDVDLFNILQKTLKEDSSIYKLAPGLNIKEMLSVYHSQHMNFPIYIYSETEEPYIEKDCKDLFSGISVKYFFGDLEKCIKKCDDNFTYIFSNIDLVENAAQILTGTCSHILLARDYRYNYINNCKTFKKNLNQLAKDHPFIRVGTTLATDQIKLAANIIKIIKEDDTI